MSASTAAAYKARKEAFVSNLSGSSLTDINLVTLVAPAAVLLWTALQKRQSLFTPVTPVALIADFLLNVCAILFAFTLYSSAPILLNILLAVPAVFLLLPLLPAEKSSTSRRTNKKDAAKGSEAAKVKFNKLPNRPFITHYRGTMMVATCVAILAVDFPVFPRRFAKVETWGTSLMDLGVGSFVFSAGVVSARQVLTTSSTPTTTIKTTSPINRLMSSLRHSAPLLILGLIRLYSVKGLDYAEHVTEYGVHWNFFFTLGLLPPFISLADTILQYIPLSYETLAILIAIIYEIVLDNTSLLRYILISPRGPSLLSKNREGVFSFIGYLSIFLSGRGTGIRILPFHSKSQSQSRSSSTSKSTTKPTSTTPITTPKALLQDKHYILKSLLLSSAIYIILFLSTTSYSIPILSLNLNPSRRLANLPYTLWISAYNTGQLFLFALIEYFGPSDTDNNDSFSSSPLKTNSSSTTAAAAAKTSQILKSLNKNGLAIFLVANLCTGLVNLTFNTLDARNEVAMAILIVYAAVIAAVGVALDFAGVKVKL